MKTEFEAGQQHTNRKGLYTVILVDGDAMHIRWKNGEEVVTSVKMQSQILDNMERELHNPALALSESVPKTSKTTRSR